MKKFVLTVMTVAALLLNMLSVHAAQICVYNVEGKQEYIEESAFNIWHAQGWYSAPVMRVYNLDGEENVAVISDFGIWHAQGWYSAPVMRVYNLDGEENVAAISDFGVWHDQGWYSAPVMRVYNLDGKEMVAAISEFAIWHEQGWYSAPVMKVYSRNGDSMVIMKSDLNYWRSEGWFETLSDAKVELYLDDGQSIEVFDYEVQSYIDAGWYTEKYVPEAVSINELEGQYQDEYSQRASMNIQHLYDNVFRISVLWSYSAASESVWDMSMAYLDRNGKLNYSDCYSYTEEYDYDKEEIGIVEDYYDGNGYFYRDDGYLKWEEIIRGVEADTEKCKFVKIN